MSDLHDLLERFAETGEQRGADAVFDTAVTTVAHRRKQRRLGAALVGVVVLTIAIGAVVTVMAHRDQGPRVVTAPTSPATLPAGTAARLIGGHWDTLPPAPIATRESPSIAWTGEEMLVWGGVSGHAKPILHADGAAYDPRSRSWRQLPAAPLTPRQYASAAWTGTELVIWGGYTNTDGSAIANDGAAYNPVTNRWRKLAPSPLPAQATALAVWDGRRVVILSTNSNRARAYDPAADRWQLLTPPKPAEGMTPAWRYALRINDHRVLLWSHAETSTSLGRNGVSVRVATTMLLYDDSTDEWQRIPAAANTVPDIHEAFWTGTEVIVRGDMRDCDSCQGPPGPEVVASYRPDTNTWARLPSEPLEQGVIGGGGRNSVWTGAALWSFEPFDPRQTSDGSNDRLAPGQASVYDPAPRRWTRIAQAPFACANIVDPVWAGNEVLIYCPSGDAGGLSYIAGR
jgi:hypothetical protein